MNNITKLVCILALVVVLLIGIIFLRKYMIFEKYRLAQEEFSKSVNFYVKDKEENGTTEIYRAGSKALIINNSEIKRMSYYDDNQKISYTEYELDGADNVKKTAIVEPRDKSLGDSILPVLTDDSFKLESSRDSLEAAFKYKISNAKVDNYDCYEFTIDKEFSIYVNKEDYFKIREENYSLENTVIDYKASGVSDEDVFRPMLEGYEVVYKTEEN